MMRLSDYIPTIAVFLATASAQVYAADPAAAAASNHCVSPFYALVSVNLLAWLIFHYNEEKRFFLRLKTHNGRGDGHILQ